MVRGGSIRYTEKGGSGVLQCSDVQAAPEDCPTQVPIVRPLRNTPEVASREEYELRIGLFLFRVVLFFVCFRSC